MFLCVMWWFRKRAKLIISLNTFQVSILGLLIIWIIDEFANYFLNESFGV